MKYLIIIIIVVACFWGYQKFTSNQQVKVETKKEVVEKEPKKTPSNVVAPVEETVGTEEKKIVSEEKNIYNLFQKKSDPMVSIFTERQGHMYISDCYNIVTDTQVFDEKLALLAINHYKEDLAKFVTLKDYDYFKMAPFNSVNPKLYYLDAYLKGIKLMLIKTEYLCRNYKHEDGFLLLKDTLKMQSKFRYPPNIVAFNCMRELDVACINTIKRLLSTSNLAKEDVLQLKELLPKEVDYAAAAKSALDGELQILQHLRASKNENFLARSLRQIPEDELKNSFTQYQEEFCKLVEKGTPAFPQLSNDKHKKLFRQNVYFYGFMKNCKVPKL